jgi:hypothetical protein
LSENGSYIDSVPDENSCNRELALHRSGPNGFWPKQRPKENIYGYYYRTNKLAIKFCSQLLKDNNLKISDDESTGCIFDAPRTETSFYKNLSDAAVSGQFPDNIQHGSICTELPLRPTDTMSNKFFFAPLLAHLSPGADWPEIKQEVLKEGFIESSFEEGGYVRWNWVAVPTLIEDDAFFLSPTFFSLYAGPKHIGVGLKNSCQNVDDVRCNELTAFKNAKPDNGLCVTLDGVMGP